MDVRMGGITGIETLQRLREFDSKTPVILMTARHHADGHPGRNTRLRLYSQAFDALKLEEMVDNPRRGAVHETGGVVRAAAGEGVRSWHYWPKRADAGGV